MLFERREMGRRRRTEHKLEFEEAALDKLTLHRRKTLGPIPIGELPAARQLLATRKLTVVREFLAAHELPAARDLTDAGGLTGAGERKPIDHLGIQLHIPNDCRKTLG